MSVRPDHIVKLTLIREPDQDGLIVCWQDRVEVSDYMKLTTLLFSSGECHATMRLAKKGFTLGEVIPVEFFIDNSSHHELYKVSLLLKMVKGVLISSNAFRLLSPFFLHHITISICVILQLLKCPVSLRNRKRLVTSTILFRCCVLIAAISQCSCIIT